MGGPGKQEVLNTYLDNSAICLQSVYHHVSPELTKCGDRVERTQLPISGLWTAKKRNLGPQRKGFPRY